MTAQRPDRIINENKNIDLGELRLYGIAFGDINSNYGWGKRFETNRKPQKVERVSSACWSGYTNTYLLSQSGHLYHVGFEYPFNSNTPDKFEDELEGDFFLVMKKSFFGSRTYIPFKDGIIKHDQTKWIIEPGEEEKNSFF